MRHLTVGGKPSLLRKEVDGETESQLMAAQKTTKLSYAPIS